MLSVFRVAKQASKAFSGTTRGFASDAAPSKSGGGFPLFFALAGGGAGLYYAQVNGLLDSFLGVPAAFPKTPTPTDYDAVRKSIADIVDTHVDYDDGSYGPILVRLAWHTSGTYDKATGTGGSNGATMRFAPEANWGANAGLSVGRDLLEPVKAKYPWISYSDLWTLAGAVAVEAMGGPTIPWRPGRSDKEPANHVPLPDGRLPDGAEGAAHVRSIFYRMGFNDQEIVALVGAHCLGRCHTDRSGWDGPWTNAPTTFSNQYYQELRENNWRKKKWNGPVQYEDKHEKNLMMLPADMALLWDRKFKKWVDVYAKDEEKFFADFAPAFAKLLELGVPFDSAPSATPLEK